MRTLMIACFCVFLSHAGFAAELDQAYLKTFGGGKVIVSGKGVPALGMYDPSQFTFKDGIFFIPGGKNGFFHARALLPEGKTIGQVIDDAKKKFSANVKFLEEEITAFRVWCSHDEGGNLKVGGQYKWPASMNDEPGWASNICDFQTTVDQEKRGWVGQAAKWEDNLKSDVERYLVKARAGTKFFVQFSVGFSSLTPGGQMESKWDSILNKFVQVKSQGLLSYNLMPVAVGTVEVAEGYTPTWTWKMLAKPSKEDGEAEGLISILKAGKEFCQAKVRVKNKYTNTQSGIINWDVSLQHSTDESKRGGFDADAKSLEGAIEKVLEEFAERELAEQ